MILAADGVELTDDDCWRAMQARDSHFDGVFVCAVRSTGIYCRPSCPSRRAKREHVQFFPTPDAAERAGFRACRRCQPREPVTAQEELVQRARRLIEEQVDDQIGLAALGQELGVSPYHLQRTFKRVAGVTPRQYAESCRMARLKARLRDGEGVASALYGAGFGSSSRLYERARAELGMTPRAYRRGGQGVQIGYALADCSLGRLLVAGTEHGLCMVALGDSDADLSAHLAAEYPAADVRRDEGRVRAWADALVAHLAGRPALDVPIDAPGSDFQRRVWEALLTIPYGSTRTYEEVARSIGQPAATRAVAHACATNPVAIVVPCHRVVRKDGGLGGYRWGLERKRALLDRERAAAGSD
jgi:AraC family transcriptional regulator of adaptative response/methylated-DNA-[protein]-cysteine methyltransferase